MVKSLDEVMKEYMLSEEEYKRIEEEIIHEMLMGKKPVENPIAAFHIGPSGSGKTGLNGYGVSLVQDGNIIVINNDELKPRHPRTNEILRLYPEYYIKVTNEASKRWTDALVNRAVADGYNIIYEGTGRKMKLFEMMMSKMNGYDIVVRAMAVNELNCLMSILERYLYQIQVKGWGRLVPVDTFYKAYDGEMLDTVETMERSERVCNVEVYKRGRIPTEPIRVYSSNDDIKRYPNAKSAIQDFRKRDSINAIQCFEDNFNKIQTLLSDRELTIEERTILEKIQELYVQMLAEQEREID